MTMTDEVEVLDEPTPQSVVDYWRKQIEAERTAHKTYREEAEAAQDAYDKKCTYNIMWSSVEITQAALYSSTPNPEVRRRQKDGDDTQKQAANVVERAIDFCVDNTDFDGNTRSSIRDFLVASNGVGRVMYNPEITAIPDAFGQPVEQITAQLTEVEHYSWKHFGWQPSKSWERCEWVYFVHMLSKKAVKDKYEVEASETDDDGDDEKKVKVYEIYHKPSASIIVIADQFDTPLEVRDDELGLKGFFPCPAPMMTNVKTDKLIPSPDFKYYEAQFKSLDRTSNRIKSLVTASKAAGFYDAHFRELAKYQTAKDGMLMPVDDMADKLQGNSLDNIIAPYPIRSNVEAIEMLVANKQYLKEEVFEILGISDIMRGETDSQEGVETQQLKSEFGAVRIRDKQAEVNRYCRDVFRLMGEVIAEHFEPDVLQKITGIEITPEIMEILRSDMLRNVSIDIETDSTNAGDKLRRRQAQNEALDTLLGGLSSLLPGIQQGIVPKPLGQELMLMLVRSTDANTGNLEDIISRMGDEGSPEAIIQQLQQQLQELQQQAQMMQQELEKRDQATMAKDMSSAELNQAKAQETLSKIPLHQSEVEQNQVETSGKRVEQAANIVTGMQGREPFIRGVE
jgi:hypothetical protein